MQTPNFRVTVVQEADTVEICGALKVRELITTVRRSRLELVVLQSSVGSAGEEADGGMNPVGFCA